MITALLVSALLVLTCVGIHYQALVWLTQLSRTRAFAKRSGINVLVLGALLAHVVEVSVFAVGYAVLDGYGEDGGLIDSAGDASHDYWYFSFVAYTSLGFGDITPRGGLRFFTALETLTGLVLIAWTASFVFIEMQSRHKALGEREG